MIYVYIHTYNGILLSNEKERNLAICNDVDGTESIMLSEIRQSEKRQISYDVTHMWNLRNPTDEHRGREGKIR